MRLHVSPNETLLISDSIKTLGQELLLAHNFSREHHRFANFDYAIGKIIEACFVDDLSANSAKLLCKKLAKAFKNYDISSSDYRHALEALVSMQPISFLNGFLGDETEIKPRTTRVFSANDGERSNLISNIDNELIIQWCEIDPIIKYPFIAASIRPYQKREQDESLEWTSLAKEIITKSSDPLVILNEFESSFRPMFWRGSRAEILRKRLCLFADLKNHVDPLVSQWAFSEEVKFTNEIRNEEKHELETNRSVDERFE